MKQGGESNHHLVTHSSRIGSETHRLRDAGTLHQLIQLRLDLLHLHCLLGGLHAEGQQNDTEPQRDYASHSPKTATAGNRTPPRHSHGIHQGN